MSSEALKAAQLELARRELLARQDKPQGLSGVTGVAPLRKEGQTFGQALRENIVGEGEVDTFGVGVLRHIGIHRQIDAGVTRYSFGISHG